MYQFMNVKKYRVRFAHKTIVVYEKTLDAARRKAQKIVNTKNRPIEIYRV